MSNNHESRLYIPYQASILQACTYLSYTMHHSKTPKIANFTSHTVSSTSRSSSHAMTKHTTHKYAKQYNSNIKDWFTRKYNPRQYSWPIYSLQSITHSTDNELPTCATITDTVDAALVELLIYVELQSTLTLSFYLSHPNQRWKNWPIYLTVYVIHH